MHWKDILISDPKFNELKIMVNLQSEPCSPLTCREFVELVTDYLEGALRPALRQAFDVHWATCEGCQIYLEQMQQTLKLVGRLNEADIPVRGKEKLLDLFRDWKRDLSDAAP